MPENVESVLKGAACCGALVLWTLGFPGHAAAEDGGNLANGAMVEVASPHVFRDTVQPFLQEYCFDCHGPEKQKAQIRYDGIEGFELKDRHLWTLVHEQLSEGSMPPEDKAQPEEMARRKVIAWIESEQRALRAGSTRRLNRRELSAALRDVTGLSVDYARALPEDGKVDGFDTGSDGLQDAAESVARIMEVTRRAVGGIRFLEPSRSTVFTADFREIKDARKALDHWKEAGAYVKPRGHARPGEGVLMDPKWLGDRGDFSFNLPVPANGRGVLRLELTVSVTKGKYDGIPDPHLWVEVGGSVVDRLEITAPSDDPVRLSYAVQIDDLPVEKRGLQVALHNKVEMPYAVEGFENDEKANPDENIPGGSTGLFRPKWNKKERKLTPEEQPYPFIVLQRMEVEMNHAAEWPPQEWKADVGNLSDDTDSAKRLLALWVERAWRRPVGAAEQERFFELYETVRGQGASFDEALRAAFQSVLLSAGFRYLRSPEQAAADGAHDAIASRLSLMLTGSPPDVELRRLARDRQLRDPDVLDAQVERLLAGPHSDAFVRPFVKQWLELGQPITLAMDHIKKQDFRFGRHLKASMEEESIAYVAELLADNRPARELIDSDWTTMNNILARHYGYSGIEGSQMRKVTLRPEDPRGGGLLGHAGIQSMLCWMGDNWVIYRGAWTLRHILNHPPPPPPLEVPELDPEDPEHRGMTRRELLLRHQEDANCSVCHRTMDPMGFAFQNFDLSGRWRDVEFESYQRDELDGKIAWRGTGESRPVDAVGSLPRGEAFESFDECKELMAKHYQEDLVNVFLKNLILYGTGRKPDATDKDIIRNIVAAQASQGCRLRDLLKALVRSPAFLGTTPAIAN